ncbi:MULTISPECIES: DUF6397 family protein [unclassified Streptomyces]|uniref:DUF6397 family protein n=1 Tax=unclassified Streptomyces TaxID=2593676 RepID=UPI003D72C225
MSENTLATPPTAPRTPGRAARELGLKRSELDLAVHLGRIRTVPDEDGGRRRVPGAEIARIRAAEGHPEALRAAVRTVGTAEGARLLSVPVGRFTRLARLGLVVPVTFYLNRYRAVVWLYLADELRQFAHGEGNARLLKGRTPDGLRRLLAEGVDLRPRNWRGRHLGFLLRQADGPWQRAGALAAFLDPARIAEIVPDPYERAHLNRFRPGPPTHGSPGSPAARLAEKIMTADGPDEIAWLRSDLEHVLDEARTWRSAPRPAARVPSRTEPAPPPAAESAPTPRSGLLGWLRRRTPRPKAP